MKVYEYACKISGVIGIGVGVGLLFNGRLEQNTAIFLGAILYFLAWLSIAKIIKRHTRIAIVFLAITILGIVEMVAAIVLSTSNYIIDYKVYWGLAVIFLILAQKINQIDHKKNE